MIGASQRLSDTQTLSIYKRPGQDWTIEIGALGDKKVYHISYLEMDSADGRFSADGDLDSEGDRDLLQLIVNSSSSATNEHSKALLANIASIVGTVGKAMLDNNSCDEAKASDSQSFKLSYKVTGEKNVSLAVGDYDDAGWQVDDAPHLNLVKLPEDKKRELVIALDSFISKMYPNNLIEVEIESIYDQDEEEEKDDKGGGELPEISPHPSTAVNIVDPTSRDSEKEIVAALLTATFQGSASLITKENAYKQLKMKLAQLLEAPEESDFKKKYDALLRDIFIEETELSTGSVMRGTDGQIIAQQVILEAQRAKR